ncbi:MAG: sugar nucleotide-binding protein, partial [SAR324 cluster bacterium]|nr:sugar nucleotide-binding protein [SAR324 cluster bacterium]
MKIFLTGASGMLAADVIPELKAMGHVIVETDAKPRLEHIQVLDITDAKQVDEKINAASANFVFHLAAKTN